MVLRRDNKITSVYVAEGLIDSWYDHTLNVLVIRFFKLNLGAERAKAFDYYEEAAKAYNPGAIILDTSEARGMHTPSDEIFFRNRTFPAIQKFKIKNFISVSPKNPLAMMGVKEMMDIGDEYGFTYTKAASLEEAYAILENGMLKDK